MSSKDDDLQKGLGKLLATTALAGTMALSNGVPKSETLPPKSPKPVFSATELKPDPGFDKGALQQAMAHVESNNGQNTNHELLTRGPDAGTKAKGHYGFTNSTIKSLIQNSPSLKQTHKHVLDFNDDQMHNLIYNEQPHLQHHLASEQIGQIIRGVGSNKPEHVAYAWLNGITGTKKALQEGKDIKNHWHVKKVMDAYNNIVNKQVRKNNKDIVEILIKKDKTYARIYAKPSPEKGREISLEIQSLISEQWKKARESLNADDTFDSTKPSPLENWNVDLEELKNNESKIPLINLLKSQSKSK